MATSRRSGRAEAAGEMGNSFTSFTGQVYSSVAVRNPPYGFHRLLLDRWCNDRFDLFDDSTALHGATAAPLPLNAGPACDAVIAGKVVASAHGIGPVVFTRFVKGAFAFFSPRRARVLEAGRLLISDGVVHAPSYFLLMISGSVDAGVTDHANLRTGGHDSKRCTRKKVAEGLAHGWGGISGLHGDSRC